MGLGRIACVSLALCASLFGYGVNELKPPYRAEAGKSIQIDGVLDEDVWHEASSITDLVQVYPDDSGLKPNLGTTIKVIYTDDALYVGFWCETPKDKQLGRLSFRDSGGVERDWFRVSLDPSGQGVNGYYMELALGGSLRDGTIIAPRRRAREWDGPWVGKTFANNDGWGGEMYLPWSMFAMPDVDGDERRMGIHFERWVSHLRERWSWEPLSDRDPRFLSGFSKLNIRNINSKSSLLIYPYAAGSQDHLGNSNEAKGGLDLFWNPAPGLRVAATALPDFGQVESDDVVVNLGAFEVFFPEKRPFFLEDRDIYNTRKYNLVHTRRIGGNPDLPDLGDGLEVENLEGATDILAASKLTGQRGKYRFGAMLAIEDDSSYQIRDSETGEVVGASSQGREYYTGRIMRETNTSRGDYFSAGWLGTYVNRPVIEREAQVHSLDAQYRSPQGKWNVAAQALASDIDENSERERGYGTWIDATYRPNKEWRHWGELVYFDDTININDMGFLWRNDQRWLGYEFNRDRNDIPGFLRMRTNGGYWRGENNRGRVIDGGIWAGHSWHFLNQTTFRVRASYENESWNDRISRDNGDVRIDDRIFFNMSWDSDSRRKMGLFVQLRGFQEAYEDRVSLEARINTRYTVNQHLDFRLSTSFRKRDGWLLWREDTTFAAFDATELVPNLRANILFSPKQDLRMVLQWFAIQAEAADILQLQENGDLRLDSNAVLEDYDFVIGSLAYQIRYRYEFAPLSDLFVVYSLGGFYEEEPGGRTPGLGSLFSDTLDNKTADQFLVKLRYRFD